MSLKVLKVILLKYLFYERSPLLEHAPSVFEAGFVQKTSGHCEQPAFVVGAVEHAGIQDKDKSILSWDFVM